jgi:hypothetical protein
LITKGITIIHRQVPWLGDLPLVGCLFRYDAQTQERQELLLILTPHVVRSKQDADRIKQMEAARMHWCLGDVHELHGPTGIYPDIHNPLDDTDATVIYPDLGQEGGLPDGSTPGDGAQGSPGLRSPNELLPTPEPMHNMPGSTVPVFPQHLPHGGPPAELIPGGVPQQPPPGGTLEAPSDFRFVRPPGAHPMSSNTGRLPVATPGYLGQFGYVEPRGGYPIQPNRAVPAAWQPDPALAYGLSQPAGPRPVDAPWISPPGPVAPAAHVAPDAGGLQPPFDRAEPIPYRLPPVANDVRFSHWLQETGPTN